VLSLAKNTQPLQLGRVAWLTALLPITVAGPRPICTALPHFPSLQVVKTVYGARRGVSMKWRSFLVRRSAVFPVGLAFFDQRAQALLGIFQAVQFVQENIHGLF